jgi:EmrB/QacA subfamily drug resistance transporter
MTELGGAAPMTAPPALASFLATRRGRLTLVFLCAVAFLDFVDTSIVNVALPSIRQDLHFSIQNLQWVLSGYVLTYGGFLLLGGRAADLLGRRRILVGGTALFALSSVACGVAQSSGMLVGARLAQGLGAAMMTPAALSILTTSFNRGTDRLKALGAWGAMVGVASAVGVFLGGLLSGGPGWQWVFFVNPPICVLVVLAAFRLVDNDTKRSRLAHFDTGGAILATGAISLTIYALVRAPVVGWNTTRTIAELAGAAALLVVFLVNERRHPNPLVPLSIFRIKGLAAADGTQIIAIAGFFSMFFFITLYMQNVLLFSATKAGAAYIPVALGVAISAGICSRLFVRTGTRPIMVAGALLAAGGVYWLSRIPVHGSYASDLLPGLLIMSVGLGAVFVAVQTAANAGVPPDKAGLAASLINASFQLGAALGLAIFSAIATSRTNDLVARHVALPDALTSGFHRALLASSIFLVAAAAIALRATNTKGEPMPAPETRHIVTATGGALDAAGHGEFES